MSTLVLTNLLAILMPVPDGVADHAPTSLVADNDTHVDDAPPDDGSGSGSAASSSSGSGASSSSSSSGPGVDIDTSGCSGDDDDDDDSCDDSDDGGGCDGGDGGGDCSGGDGGDCSATGAYVGHDHSRHVMPTELAWASLPVPFAIVLRRRARKRDPR